MARTESVKVIVGYSFGVSPTSVAGVLNERIAERLKQDVMIEDGDVFIGVQWEIEDVLRRFELNRDRDLVVAPAFFSEDDVSDLNGLRDSVLAHKPFSQAIASISMYPKIHDVFSFSNRAISYLNRLLYDTAFFRQFDSIALPSLTKTKAGREWVELRSIPAPSSPDLEMYQAQRLNRLILEHGLTGFSEASRRRYVGTIHVADAVFHNINSRGLTVARVSVYGHPAHVERCRIQTLESAWRIGFRLYPNDVDVVPCGESDLNAPANWDPDNAQEWIRSWNNWKRHEGISRT